MLQRLIPLFLLCTACNISLNASFCDTNQHFYQAVGPVGLAKLAETAGLESGIDIKHIADYIQGASVILEVGAGYGRAGEFIIKEMASNASLYLVETAPCYVQCLKSKFKKPVTVIPKAVQNLNAEDLNHQKPNLILWMWSGICDVDFEEQQVICEKLSRLLAPNGLIMIDVPYSSSNGTSTAGATSKGSIELLEIDKIPRYTGHLPSLDQMHVIAKEIGCVIPRIVKYRTPTDRWRILYYLWKQPS